ncbi:WD repeat protein-like protein [Xylogone sp. PMI_703]|nr:WD repeat protein-like protein [Xylogone sp. PMI_703]
MAAKKVRQRISYVLPLANSSGGHRLGVNGLAVDRDQSILYTGGRDGVICAWDLNLDLVGRTEENPFASPEDPEPEPEAKPKAKPKTTFRAQTQAHTHWINDIVLTQNKTALVSASSDLTVKVWRPQSSETTLPQTIGQHADYVKCVATPNVHSDWVASGGLDRRICLWDLNGAGKKLEIEVGDEEKSEKGSVYALSVSNTILASGGPESIVRLWDTNSGKRITKFVGHTDNVRAILVSESGDTIMTASSDQTVKVWSVTAGRCMHTLTMHNDSVWGLFSDDPDLGVFYSCDRSGLVVKTDVRGTLGEMDDGISIAVAQENEGVNKVLACGGYIWTATSSSSINRWADVDTGNDIQLPEAFRHHRASSAASRPSHLSPPLSSSSTNGQSKKEIPAKSLLRISNTATFPARGSIDPETKTTISAASTTLKGSEIAADSDISVIEPVHSLPEETIEGLHGLVKHKMLNDRRRALTLDTAGDALLWDLLRSVPIKSFGKRHLEDIEPEVNTMEAVSPWCSIDTRTGQLTVTLEEYNCFDAEMYADELQLDEPVEFREDQRINLGKWVLRYLFAKTIDEEIKRDEAHRKEINEAAKQRQKEKRANAPGPIEIPTSPVSGWEDGANSVTTPRANGFNHAATPGMAIGLATPAVTHLPGVPENGTLKSQTNQGSGDYFSSAPAPSDANASGKVPATPIEPSDDKLPKSPTDDKENGAKEGRFGKKFRMGFGSKKLNRSVSASAEKPAAAEDKPAEEGSEASEPAEKEVDDSFFGIVQKIRNEYEKALQENPDEPVESGITPSLPNETPVIKFPPGTALMIQEDTTGGSADVYRGSVDTVGEDASLIEEHAPMWLGDLLLRNRIPIKEPSKVSFVLQPWKDLLPSIAGPDGNSRLNANRMLRVKKILAYVAERIEPAPEKPDPDALKPEEYLELYCYDQKLPITMSLATLRAHVWKGGADVMLYYKSNGRKPIKYEKTVPEESTESQAA